MGLTNISNPKNLGLTTSQVARLSCEPGKAKHLNSTVNQIQRNVNLTKMSDRKDLGLTINQVQDYVCLTNISD